MIRYSQVVGVVEDGVFIFVLSLFLFFYFKENYNFPKFQESGAAFSWRGGGGGATFSRRDQIANSMETYNT